jgi:hypothetical protein
LIVYRSGALTRDNFTPRPERDTQSRPGQEPGLSTFESFESGSGRKYQKIDLSRLKPPLQGFPDDPAQGGTPGHVSIAPADAAGKVDQEQLEEWAATRGTQRTHPLTQIVLDAVVEADVRS